MLVYDLKKDFRNLEPLWNDCISFIKKECRSDKLYKNYINIDLKRFLSMAIVVVDDRIICFGGAEINVNRWGPNLSRVLSRFWISPEYRHRLVKVDNNTEINFSPLILDKNITALINHPEIKAAMITREGDGKNSFFRIVDIANTAVKKPFVILEEKHNVCGDVCPIPDSCKQMIALKMLTEDLSIEEFLKNLYSNTHFKKC